MNAYFLRRALAVIPTFFGITVIVFIILNLAPGGPVEQMIRQIRFGKASGQSANVAGQAASVATDTGVTQDIIEAMKKQYGFDKPIILNTRIADRKIGGIDVLAELLFALDTSADSPAFKKLESRGMLVLKYLIPALLDSRGSDVGLVDLISENGLQSVREHKQRLFRIPPKYYPPEKQPAAIQTALNAATELFFMALDCKSEQRPALLRTAKILLRTAETNSVPAATAWNNPVSEPFIRFLRQLIGPDAVTSRETLAQWWRHNQSALSATEARRTLYQVIHEGADPARLLPFRQLAVPELFRVLPDLNDAQVAIIAPLIEKCTDRIFGAVDSPDAVKHYKNAALEWWKENRLTYVELTPFRRAVLSLTETRYGAWLKNILTLDFGQSFTYDQPVIDVIASKMPVSIQFGVISFFATYLVCIPLGIAKAVHDGTVFDYTSSIILFLLWSVPGFMLAVLLIVFFGGGSFFHLIPIGGLFSDNYASLSFWGKVWDRIHHFIAPLICYMIAEFTTLTLLMKNSIIEEISKDYCRTARAKGLSERSVYLKHALRNALIPIATGIGGFLGIFFAGSMLLEMIFNLDGMGLLGYTSVLSRDFNVIMGNLVILSLISLVGNIISDFIYTVVDPRIDFI